jgi:tellurite resistance protein TerC
MTRWLPGVAKLDGLARRAKVGPSLFTMPAISEPYLWTGFLVFLGVVLSLDLFVFHRKSRAMGVREAIFWVVVWAACAMGFAGLLYALPNEGPNRTMEFLTGYVLEQALSVDNLFVFVVIFGGFGVKKEYQHRVLFWGIFGAIVLRGTFILAGAAVVERFHWVLYFFGAFLIYTGIKLLRKDDGDDDDDDIEKNRIVILARRFLPVTDGYRKDRFFVREAGKLMVTPLFLVLVVVELSDVVFAVDSIPAIFAVTTHPLVVFTSNMFAILGLRNVYIILEDMLPRFRYLETAVSIVLIFIGVKILLPMGGLIDPAYAFHMPTAVSLGVVATLLIGSVVLSSVIKEPEEEAAKRREKFDRITRMPPPMPSGEMPAPVTKAGDDN